MMDEIINYDQLQETSSLTPADINALRVIENLEVALTGDEISAIANSAEHIVDNITNTINNVAVAVRDIKQVSARVEIETARLDHALDTLLIKTQNNLEMYKATLPLLEKNFAGLQSRMDHVMDRVLDMICSDVSENAIAKQEAAMKLVEMTNDGLNRLIAKLLPFQ